MSGRQAVARSVAIVAAVAGSLLLLAAPALARTTDLKTGISYGDSQLIDDGVSIEVAGGFACTLGDTYTVQVAVTQHQRNHVVTGDATETDVLCVADVTTFDVAPFSDSIRFAQRIAAVGITVTDTETGVVRTAVFHKVLNT
jgi:hypothetical protein